MKKAAIIVGILAVVAVLAVALTGGPSDEEKILQALDDSIAASREGKAGGVLEHLSRSITFNGEPIASSGEISSYVRKAKPDIIVLNRDVEINGETATLVTPVDLELSYGPVSTSHRLDNVEITFRQEMGTRYGIIPASKWRVVEVKAPTFDFNMPMPGLQ